MSVSSGRIIISFSCSIPMLMISALGEGNSDQTPVIALLAMAYPKKKFTFSGRKQVIPCSQRLIIFQPDSKNIHMTMSNVPNTLGALLKRDGLFPPVL
jgi:hypothetical protein